jgi:hypothetical protein
MHPLGPLGNTVVGLPQPPGTIAVSPLVLIGAGALIVILVVVAIVALTTAAHERTKIQKIVKTADDAARAAALAAGVNEEMVMQWVESGDRPSMEEMVDALDRPDLVG